MTELLDFEWKKTAGGYKVSTRGSRRFSVGMEGTSWEVGIGHRYKPNARFFGVGPAPFVAALILALHPLQMEVLPVSVRRAELTPCFQALWITLVCIARLSRRNSAG